MDPENDEPLTLPKWPFYVGDAFLVGSAISIAFLGGWNLTDWQVASCVIAVGLGAFLFVLPFIVEYQLRLKERGEGVSRLQATLEHHFGVLAQRIETLEEDAAGWQARLDTIVNGSEGVTKRVETKVAGLAEAVEKASGVTDEVGRMKKELSALSSETNERIAAIKEDLPEDSGVQAAVFASLSEKVSALSARIDALEKPVETPGQAGPENDIVPAATPDKRAPRRKKEPGPQLLHRAIRETGESSTPAVSRIISAGPKPKAEEPAPEQASPESAAVEPEQVRPVAPEPVRPVKPAVLPENSGSADKDVDADALFSGMGEAVPKQRKPRRRKGQGRVVAKVLIGIGNKPFLRGSGGGLDWEKGVAMEFDEIGKWSWTAPPECGEIEVRVYRNDEDPDIGGNGLLKPGETLELSPKF